MKKRLKTSALLLLAIGATGWLHAQSAATDAKTVKVKPLPGQYLEKKTPAIDVSQQRVSPLIKGKRTLQIVEDRNQTYMASKVYELKHTTGADMTPFVLGAVLRYNKNSRVERLNYAKTGQQFIVVHTAEQMIPYVDDMVAKLDRPGIKNDSGSIIDGDGIYRFVYYPKFRDATVLVNTANLFGSGDGKRYADASVNMVYWKDSKSDGLGQLKWLQAMDRPVPQVELLIKAYEFNDNDVKELGVDFVSWKNGPGAELMGFGGELSQLRVNQEMFGQVTDLFSNISSNFGGFMFAPQFDASFIRMLDQKGKANVYTSGSITVANDFSGSYRIQFTPGYQNISKTSLMEMSIDHDNDMTFDFVLNSPIICFDDSANVAGTLMFNYEIDMQSVVERNNVGTEFINHNIISSTLTLKCGTEKLLSTFKREHDVSQYNGVPFIGDIPLVRYLVGTETHSVADTRVCLTVVATPVAPDASLSKWAGELVTAVEMLQKEKTENNW